MFLATNLCRSWCCIALFAWGLMSCGGLGAVIADEAGERSATVRCQVVPLADHQVAFTIDGVEKVRWHYGQQYPRPFFYPLRGPSGASLTRMGHPGAPDHDHHQSIWFAHNKINGLDFWSNTSQARIRQKQWLCYQDGDEEATMAVLLGWYDANGTEIMEQELIASLLPIPLQGSSTAADSEGADGGPDGEPEEHGLELQFTLRPAAGLDAVEVEKSNFGFLAVRVAKSISAAFGGGQLSNSEGGVGESQIFGKSAKWMDYSGPVAVGQGKERSSRLEGITFFDHPQNPRYPTHWHVRQDGWMGASFGLQEAWQISREQPLTLRYFLVAHANAYDAPRAERVFQQFSQRSAWRVSKGTKPHYQHEVQRQ